MFGYIKTKKEELLVKDLALYKSVYCGLCREIKKNISFFIPFSLSYDFVFLAMVRDILTEGKISTEAGRCPYNPAKKRSFITSDGIKYASKVSLILIKDNIDDKRRDGDRPLLSPFLALASLYLKTKCRKHLKSEEWQKLCENIKIKMNLFSDTEKAHGNADDLAASFGEVLGEAVAFGLEGSAERIARSVGQSVGAWLYLADAVDDLEKDYARKKFNPLLEEYKTPEEAKSHFRDIDAVIAAHARDAHTALSLSPNHEYCRITDNILSMGLGWEIYGIMNSQRRKK